MGTEQTLDDVLEHYGIKGMRWGVRRTDEQLARARGRRRSSRREKSPDAAAAEEAKKKAKKGGVSSLSNQELKKLNERLNLEQNYERLTSTKDNKNKLKKGEETAKSITSLGKSVNDAYNFAKSPAGLKLAAEIKKKLG